MSGVREERVEYIHLPAGTSLSDRKPEPNRTIVIVEQDVSDEWQVAVSQWIVESGCLYMMAWGRECSSWDNSVDHAVLAKFDHEEVPDEAFVMTTWHEGEPLHEVFFFARMCAFHPTIPLPLLTILDVRAECRKSAILALHEAECAGLLEDAFEDPTRLPLKDRIKILMGTR